MAENGTTTYGAGSVDTIFIVAGVFLSLAWLTVSLRMVVRGWQIHSLGADDYMMLFTSVVYTLYCAFVVLTSQSATETLGGPASGMTIAKLNRLFTYLIISMALYIATTVLFKIALGLFYLRIVIKPWQRWTIYVTVAVSTIYGTMFTFFTIFQCGNPAQFLQQELAYKCVDDRTLLALNISAGLINAISDWILGLLPVFMIRKANMPRRAKISAALILLLGSVGSISSVIRLIFVEGFTPGPHFFSTATNFTIWSIIECGVCITAASLATLRPLFRSCLEGARHLTTPTFSSKHKGTASESTWRSGGNNSNSAQQLRSGESREGLRGKQSFDFELDVPDDDRTITTVIGNSRVMEKMGVTHEAVRKASLKRAKRAERGEDRSPSPPAPPQHVVHQMAPRYREKEEQEGRQAPGFRAEAWQRQYDAQEKHLSDARMALKLPVVTERKL